MKSITRDDLVRMKDTEHEDFVLINVLSQDAFNQAHIPKSVNVPVGNDDFVATVESICGGKDRKIVVYCASFDCDASVQAAEKLDNAGFNQVCDYEGGTKDWIEQRRAA